jgi:alkaline phosphatase
MSSLQRLLRDAITLSALATLAATPAASESRLRLMPPDGSVLAAGQRFDVRAEATASEPGSPPEELRLFLDGEDVTARAEAAIGPPGTTNLLLRGLSLEREGPHVIEARSAGGAGARVRLEVAGWRPGPGTDAERPRARNVILFLGDGMGAAHRTAARILSHGVAGGRAAGRLAMDRLPVTGQVMTFSLNAVITDSAPGMASYVTGSKSNNNQQGVYPDNTLEDAFDNPRVEYLGELLRRTRGAGFRVGLVTTADVTDATPAANAVHTADRGAWEEIAARYLDEREQNGVSVLLGGGARGFRRDARRDGRDLLGEFEAAGYQSLGTGTELRALLERETVPPRLLGLFHPRHMSVAFDRLGLGRYSDELADERNAALRDQPGLPEMTRLALRSLAGAEAGFYLMVEAASIDKQAHAADAERSLWDVIELDEAVAVALAFAEETNSNADPTDDTLVIVTADHEAGGLALVGVGNERYAPRALGRAVRDYAAVYRFEPEQLLDFSTNYETDARGYPVDPDPSRKLLLGWAAAPDRYENWISNRRAGWPAVPAGPGRGPGGSIAAANTDRDGTGRGAENRTPDGKPIPGFLVTGVIETGATACPDAEGCPGDTASEGHLLAGHTATDVPLSAAGPGALQFTGTYDNTEVFLKVLRATTGAWRPPE